MFLQAVKVNNYELKFNSKWEYTIYKQIIKVLPTQYFPINVNKRLPGSRLELDFYIPKLKLAIELQGPLHLLDLKKTKRDLVKYALCKKNKIKVVYLQFYKYYGKVFFSKLFRNVRM